MASPCERRKSWWQAAIAGHDGVEDVFGLARDGAWRCGLVQALADGPAQKAPVRLRRPPDKRIAGDLVDEGVKGPVRRFSGKAG